MISFLLFILLAEYAGHAQSMMKNFDFSSVDAVIIASGDGLLYEVSMCVRACVCVCTCVCVYQFAYVHFICLYNYVHM